MLTALAAVNLILWAVVAAYALRLVPVFQRTWRPWGVGAALLAATLVSAVTYRVAFRVRARQAFQQHYAAAIDERSRGNLEEAERELQAARSLQPGNPDVERQLSELREQRPAERRVQEKQTRVDRTASSATPARPANPPPVSGTRAERPRPGVKPKPAAHKPSPFEIEHYFLDVRLEPSTHVLDATATIRVRSRGGAVPQLDFSLNPECVPAAARVDGVNARFTHTNDLFSIVPREPLSGSRAATVVVTYHREGDAIMGKGEGLLSADGTYFLSESRWYPATGELDFRAPVRVRARVPKGFTVVSVGALKSARQEGETATFDWETTRFASMVSLAAARYVQQSTQVEMPVPPGSPPARLPLTCYTFPQHRDRAAAFLHEAAAIVRFYQRKFGAYPYEKLAVAEIPLFPGGYGTTSFVMLIDKSFAEKRVDREFLAHEIAHQWWGNQVFPQGLGAAWLSEAFANYSAWMYDASVNGNPRVLQKRVERATTEYFREAAAKGDQAIGETDVYRPIGATQEIIYEKGAVVLHMLRHEIGDPAFFRVLRRFAERFRFGKAKIEDFQKIAEGESGKPLGWFFDQWLGRSGGMELSYSFVNRPGTSGRNEAVLTVDQPAPAYRAGMRVRFDLGDRTEDHTIELRGPHDEFRFPIGGRLVSVLFDPDGTYLMKPPQWVVKDQPPAQP